MGLNTEEQSRELIEVVSLRLNNNDTLPKQKKIVGWYCLNSKTKINAVAFSTYNKPNFVKRFFMRTLLDFYWVKEN